MSIDYTRTDRKRASPWTGRMCCEVCFYLKSKDTITKTIRTLAPNKTLTYDIAAHIKLEAGWRMLKGLVDGDGHVRKDDGRWSFIQKDRECIEAVQLLAIRLGLRAQVSQRSDGSFCLYMTKDNDWLSLRKTNKQKDKLFTQKYQGKVWCIRTITGAWVARREGKPFITGNTFPESLVKPMILAGSKTGNTVLDPFCGSGTTGLVCMKNDRHFIGVELNPEYAEIAEERIKNGILPYEKLFGF